LVLVAQTLYLIRNLLKEPLHFLDHQSQQLVVVVVLVLMHLLLEDLVDLVVVVE
jgi:hypothetical protein